jgi:hydrogenase large subunit
MSERIVVDPITRIEGHLRIEAQMDGENIAQAYSSGTMVRGLEIILRGRDPRDAWAFAQRICGVCTLVHGLASVRSVEAALKYPIPPNAQIIRNLMIGAQYIHDHVMHFYHSACPGLGGCGQRPERRSQGDLRPGPEPE